MDRFDDPKTYRQKRESFTRSLQHFHETRGTPFKKIPQFCGKEVDLFRLYNIVTQRGGWIKVNRTNQWDDLLEDFNIPKDCVNGGNALKQIYLRYLDRYEKVHYLGESGDRHDEEEDIESRHRRWSARSMHSVPLTYNYHQHNVVDNLRKFNGLSSDIYKASDYDRLALSLVSPLPNEQDFAINVCTILASEGKHTLRLDKCPRIIEYLLAHAGVYNHSNLRVLFEEIYGSIRGHSLSTFWSDVLESKDLLDLTDENRFVKKPPKKLKVIKVVKSPEQGTSGSSSSSSSNSNHVHNYNNSNNNQNQNQNQNHDNPPNASQSYCATPKKSDCRTINDANASASETKENETMDVRISEPSETGETSNSIENSNLNVENQPACNSINNNNNNVEGTVLGADKVETNVIIDLTDSDNKMGSENKGDTCLKVQGEDTNNDVKTSENNEAVNESGASLTSKPEGEGETDVKHPDEGTGSEKVEDVVMETEEERIRRIEEEIQKAKELAEKIERERIEEEERRKKQEEEEEERRKQKEEEDKIRAIEEAKTLERQLKEAEIYEKMMIEEERKKKPYLFEDVPAKRVKRAVKSRLKIEPEDLELFALGRENGTRDYIGQRVLQVANIFRDLSFCEESVPLMAKNMTFIRFLLLCANSKWSCLHQLGLDMLGNISPELTLEDPAIDRIFQSFFWTVYRGIHHTNRFMVLSCLEILNKICQKDENEEIVSRNLDQNLYDQICRLLTLHDVMILLYTLECLYSMSSMGEKACTFICRSKGAMEMLLAFVTVEAQYYGKEGCILMKVIETRPRGEPVIPVPTQPPPPASPGPGPPFTTAVLQNTPAQSFPSMVTTSTMTVQQTPVQKMFTPNIIRTPAPTVVGVPMAAVATPVQLPPSACPPLVQTMPTVQQQHAHQQTVQENEQFALAWLRATFELSAGGKVEQQDVYKRYVESCTKIGRKGIITASHFPRFVRSVFGGTVGPKSQPLPASEIKPGGPISQSFYEGIKVTQRQQQQQQQKILQQQLQTTPLKPVENPVKGRLARINGIIQEPVGATPENHLAPSNIKGKKEPPQPPPATTATTLGNLLRPKTPKLDGEDSDSMASTSRDCTTIGGGNVSSTDDNDNSLTSFEGMFNGIQESLDFDATLSSVVDGNCLKQKTSNEENSQKGKGDPEKQKEENHVNKQLENKDGNIVKPPQNKSLMLADLLDKKETPSLNGVLGKDLRIGEKGLELVEKAILKETHLNNKDISVNCKKDTVVSVNGDIRTGDECVTVINNEPPSLQSGSKRSATNELSSDEMEAKRLRLDGETKQVLVSEKREEAEAPKTAEEEKKKDDKEEVNGEEEVRASSTAANLFAALAAEALEDETDLEVPSEPNPQPQTMMVPGGQIRNVYLGDSSPLIVTSAGGGQIIMAPSQLQQGQVQLQQRQVLFSTGGQSLPVIVHQNQRIVQGSSGQMIVTSQPQQFIMSGNTQSQMLLAPTQMVQGQTQTVLVAQSSAQQPGTKTIIILQPQTQNNSNSQQQKMVVTSQGPQMMVTAQMPRQVVQTQQAQQPPTSLASSTTTIVSSSNSAVRDSLTTDVVLNSGIQTNPPVPPLHQNGSQIQIISSGVQNNAPILNQSGGVVDKSKASNAATIKTTVPGAKLTDEIIFLCEWRGCMRSFKTANEVYLHVCSAHCPSNPEQETQCLWERCDGMKRKRFSLMTHLSDRHCNPAVLTMMAERRRQLSTHGRSDIPAPTTPPPHLGHPPNAAFYAITRSAREFVNPKELMKSNGGKVAQPPPPPPPPPPAPLPPPPPPSAVLLAKAASPPVQVKDDVEGPVTKSIRLTASLILRNLVNYSSIGRRFLKGYEPHLANIALSNVESSRTIAQVLADLNDSSSR